MKQTIKNFLFKKRIKILKSKKGFSLIEVLVAVSIIGIISAIAFPQFQDYRKQAGKTAGDTSISNIERAFQNCVVLKKLGDCQSLSKLGVACKGCKSNATGDKFCAHIEKEAGGDTFRACVDFDGNKLVGRSYGGNLFKDIKICNEALTGCDPVGDDVAKAPQKGAVECTAPAGCTSSLTCEDSGGSTVNGTVTCDPVVETHGVCQASGVCKRS